MSESKYLRLALQHLCSPKASQNFARLMLKVMGEAGFQALEAILYNGEDERQGMAYEWLVTIRWQEDIDTVRFLEYLKTRLEAEDDNALRWKAFKALIRLNRGKLEAAYRVLFSQFLLDEDEAIRMDALRCFMIYPDRAFTPVLNLLIYDDDSSVRKQSRLALEKLATDDANYILHEWKKHAYAQP